MSKYNQPTKPAGTGKLANDRNKMGGEKPTQRNEGRRSPQSRHDRETLAGSKNQNQMRRGSMRSGQR